MTPPGRIATDRWLASGRKPGRRRWLGRRAQLGVKRVDVNLNAIHPRVRSPPLAVLVRNLLGIHEVGKADVWFCVGIGLPPHSWHASRRDDFGLPTRD